MIDRSERLKQLEKQRDHFGPPTNVMDSWKDDKLLHAYAKKIVDNSTRKSLSTPLSSKEKLKSKPAVIEHFFIVIDCWTPSRQVFTHYFGR